MPRWNAVETPSSRPRPQDGFPAIVEIMNLLDHYDEVIARFVKDENGVIKLEVDGQEIGTGGGSGVSPSYGMADYATLADTLPAFTYNNGASGVGATITGDANGALEINPGPNTVSPATNSRIVIFGANPDPVVCGIYDVTNTGGVSSPFVLTRATDFDESSEIIKGKTILIGDSNTRYANCLLVVANPSSPVIGTNDILFNVTEVDNAVQSITNGGGLTIDDMTDPRNPVLAVDAADGAEVDTGSSTAKFITPQALTDSDYIKEANLPAKVSTVVAGSGISVDNTDQANPIVSVDNTFDRLLSSTVVDFSVHTKQGLYTVPASKKCIVTKLVMRGVSGSLATIDDDVLYGFNALANDVGALVGGQVTSLIDDTLFLRSEPQWAAGVIVAGLAAEAFGVKYNGTSVSETATIDVFGYLVPA